MYVVHFFCKIKNWYNSTMVTVYIHVHTCNRYGTGNIYLFLYFHNSTFTVWYTPLFFFSIIHASITHNTNHFAALFGKTPFLEFVCCMFTALTLSLTIKASICSVIDISVKILVVLGSVINSCIPSSFAEQD